MRIEFPEDVLFEGRKYTTWIEPLSAYFAQTGMDPQFRPSGGSQRGYSGTWEVSDGRLYLIALGATKADGERAYVSTIFPGQEKVFASWFSGVLLEPDGSTPDKCPPHTRTYNGHIRITVDHGIVSIDKNAWKIPMPHPLNPNSFLLKAASNSWDESRC
jgi:hypothetical protein